MYKFVSVEMAGIHECLIAGGADERTLPGVIAFVYCEVRGVDKSLVAYFTYKRPVSRVRALVDVEGSELTERFGTNLAGVTFFVLVDTFVPREVRGVDERLLARVANVRLFSGVGPSVDVQVAGLRKRFVARIAGVPFDAAVDQSVSSEAARMRKHLVTLIALVRLSCFATVGTADHLVIHLSGFSSVRLPTSFHIIHAFKQILTHVM